MYKTRLYPFAMTLDLIMFSRDTYFLAVSAFPSNIRIDAKLEWWHHPSKYWFSLMLLSLRYCSVTPSRVSLSRIKLVIVSTSIWLSKYHRVSVRRPKQQEVSFIRESLQRTDVISPSTMFNCAMIDTQRLRIARSTACIISFSRL